MHSAHIAHSKHISCLFFSFSFAVCVCQFKHFLWLVMRCCRNFSCIEWVCVCKSFLCHGNKSSYYASSPPTFHIFLFEMFEIHSVMFNFFLLVLFLCSHDFELPRRESNVKHLLLLNVHFDLATESSRSITLNSFHSKKFQHSVGQFYCSILLPHALYNHKCWCCSLFVQRTWVYAMQSHFVASSEISVWLTFVYILKFHCNPIIILSSQNHSAEFLIYFMTREKRKQHQSQKYWGFFSFSSSAKPNSAVCIHVMNHARTMEWMCILQLLREKNEMSRFFRDSPMAWMKAFECDLL